jgi:hypothetical protein
VTADAIKVIEQRVYEFLRSRLRDDADLAEALALIKAALEHEEAKRKPTTLH